MKTINKMKRQPTEWKKIFENYITDKELISKIYKYIHKVCKYTKNSYNSVTTTTKKPQHSN